MAPFWAPFLFEESALASLCGFPLDVWARADTMAEIV